MRGCRDDQRLWRRFHEQSNSGDRVSGGDIECRAGRHCAGGDNHFDTVGDLTVDHRRRDRGDHRGTFPDIDPALRTLVDQAVADLATRLKIDASSIVTVSAQPMSWPDGSLGCPQPGMLYTQVMVDGALIELSVDGTSYSYHSGASRSAVPVPKDLSFRRHRVALTD